jgi:hypothetical protein
MARYGGVFAYVGLLTLLLAALSAIFRSGLYIYAITGTAPLNMDPALFQDTFRRKGRGQRAPTPPSDS